MKTYVKTDEEKLAEIVSRGVANIIPGREALEKLLTSGRKLNVYLGIDPTSTRIHLGNAVPLRRLQLFVELGHNVTFLIGHFSLNAFISRELIKRRLTEGKSISLPEVIYPVMQGYDSYFLDTDIQIGGPDQVFNMQAGRNLQKNLRQKESFIIENEFLPGTDGRKMSKTWGNGIYLIDTPEDVYGKVMSIADDVIESYFVLATSLPMKEVEEYKKRLSGGENPMVIKKELARVIVTELFGEEQATPSEEYFQATVVSKTPAEDAAVVRLTNPKLLMDELIGFALENNLVESKSEFRRLLEQGGISLNETRVENDV